MELIIFMLSFICMQDFIYPPNVAFGLGGNEYRYALIQMHYDNPSRRSG